MVTLILCCVIQLLAKVVHAEARGESITGMYLVASTAMNRVQDARFPNTLEEVLLQPNQFAAPADTFSAEAYNAALFAYNQPFRNILYFCNPKTSKNIVFVQSLRQCFYIGKHKFCECTTSE